MDALSRQLKKGVLDILLLKLLDRRERYGYELMTLLAEESGGYFAMKEGTLYPILYRLEDGGLIESKWEKESGRRGVPRKYYAATPEGRKRLREAGRELERFWSAVKQIMEVGENGCPD